MRAGRTPARYRAARTGRSRRARAARGSPATAPPRRAARVGLRASTRSSTAGQQPRHAISRARATDGSGVARRWWCRRWAACASVSWMCSSASRTGSTMSERPLGRQIHLGGPRVPAADRRSIPAAAAAQSSSPGCDTNSRSGRPRHVAFVEQGVQRDERLRSNLLRCMKSLRRKIQRRAMLPTTHKLRK